MKTAEDMLEEFTGIDLKTRATKIAIGADAILNLMKLYASQKENADSPLVKELVRLCKRHGEQQTYEVLKEHGVTVEFSDLGPTIK